MPEQEERLALAGELDAEVVVRERRLAAVGLELGDDALGDGAQSFRVAGRRLELDELPEEIETASQLPCGRRGFVKRLSQDCRKAVLHLDVSTGATDISVKSMTVSIHFEPWLIPLVLSVCVGFLRTGRR
jgi:hypothetical protein